LKSDSIILRLLAAAFLSLLLLGAIGCQDTATLLGAVMSQGIGNTNLSGSADNLIYKGLDARVPPRMRPGSYASPTAGTNFLDPKRLGPHGYRHNWSEKSGIVYTCKAGHIDIAHLRRAVDWTGFLAAKTLKQLKKDEIEFSFKLTEPSRYFVKIDYPENWPDLPQKEKERIAYHVSIRLGQYFAYVAATWHEILTWFGYKSRGFQQEFQSAFSWEDTFSNLLGTHIAVLALQDTEHAFSEAVTLALDRELEELDVQTKHTARLAAKKVRGLWFRRDLLFVDMKRRNFDIGLDDGFVTPWIVPSICGCEGAEAQPYPVPNLDFLSEYDLSMKLEIEPREWERAKILRILYPDAKKRRKRLEPVIHFAQIMDYIKDAAAKRYGPDVGLSNSR